MSSKCSVAGKAIEVRVPVLGISMGVWVPIDVGSFFFLDMLRQSSSLLFFDSRNGMVTSNCGRKNGPGFLLQERRWMFLSRFYFLLNSSRSRP